MNTFLVTVCELLGERQYSTSVLVAGDDEASAGQAVLSAWYEEDYEKDAEGNYSVNEGEITVQLENVKKVPDEDVEVLQKYMPHLGTVEQLIEVKARMDKEREEEKARDA